MSMHTALRLYVEMTLIPLPDDDIHVQVSNTDGESSGTKHWTHKDSDTGNRTPSYRVKGGNVSRYTISDTRRQM